MKTKFYTIVAIIAITFAGIAPVMGQFAGSKSDSVFMGKSYVNDVYYSMSAGAQGTVPRATWDIAFRASRMSASIITNDGSGVELYTYPKSDTSGWATVDTSGLSNWAQMANSTTDWEDGAFCRNQKGHPDYGWGKYNAVSHNVMGDSLFIIKLIDGSFWKIWIMEKYSSDNIFEFRFAKLDGTGDKAIELDCNPYATRNFVGYSITTNAVVDFEPVAAAQWDILFTKYIYTYPSTTPQAGTLYPVTGVLSNYKVKVAKFEDVAPDFLMTTPQVMDSTRSPIGWDWKAINMETFVFKIQDSLAYFVQNRAGNIYKLVFTSFAGSSTGRVKMNTQQVSLTAVKETEKSGFNAAIYPNPVSDVMNLVLNPGKFRNVKVLVFDMVGHTVLNQNFEIQSENLSTLRIPVSGLSSGMYMVRIQAGTNVLSRKMIVK